MPKKVCLVDGSGYIFRAFYALPPMTNPAGVPVNAVVVLACLIYSAFLSSGSPAADASLPAVTMVWEYIGEMVFNMLVLTGLVRGASRITREMFGL